MPDTNTPDTTPTTTLGIQPGRRYDAVPGAHRQSITLKGTYDVLKAVIDKVHVGRPAPDDLGDDLKGQMVAACSLVRAEGDKAELAITTVTTDKIEHWAVEMTEVQKPVKTWKSGQDDAPDLALITKWEALQSQDPEAYGTYMVDGTKLTGNTLELAKMINEWGITSYPVHTPVAVRQTLWDKMPEDLGADLDRTTSPCIRTGWTEAGLSDGYVSLSIRLLAMFWVKTADRVTVNQDGTFSRVEQWIGADDINGNLYPAPDSPAPDTKTPAE